MRGKLSFREGWVNAIDARIEREAITVLAVTNHNVYLPPLALYLVPGMTAGKHVGGACLDSGGICLCRKTWGRELYTRCATLSWTRWWPKRM